MNTTFLLCLLSFALSIDYSIALITLQAYWTEVNGKDSMIGVIFGLYDGFVIIVTPIVALLLDRSYVSYKTIFITGLILNIIGNVLYSFAYVANTWVLILLGRIISGIGASILPLLVVYITLIMDHERQKSAIGYTKYVSAITRVIGPILGILLSFIKFSNGYINQYTITGWIPTIICIIVLLLVIIWQEEEQRSPLISKNQSFEFLKAAKLFLPIMSLGFITTFIYWFFMGNGFVIAVYKFHIINNSHELGKLYYAGIPAFILAFIVFIFFQERISGKVSLWISSIIQIIISTLFLYNIGTMFYVAVGLTTFSYAILIPSINIQNSIIAKENKDILGNKMGISITALAVFQSLARFAGPSCFMLFKHLTKNENCDLHDPNHYIITGCSIMDYIPSTIVVLSVSFVLTVICLLFITITRKNITSVNYSG